MGRGIRIVFYLACFAVLTAAVYRLAFFVPPQPGEDGYELYRILAAGIAVLTGALTVGGAVALDLMLGKRTD